MKSERRPRFTISLKNFLVDEGVAHGVSRHTIQNRIDRGRYAPFGLRIIRHNARVVDVSVFGVRCPTCREWVQPSSSTNNVCVKCMVKPQPAPPPSNVSEIKMAKKPAWVACDLRCNKAWGLKDRPTHRLSGVGDYTVMMSDTELGDAPANPGTYDEGVYKPRSPKEFPNRWCVRHCERCVISLDPKRIVLPDWSKRRP